jgi:hypothetical protein
MQQQSGNPSNFDKLVSAGVIEYPELFPANEKEMFDNLDDNEVNAIISAKDKLGTNILKHPTLGPCILF